MRPAATAVACLLLACVGREPHTTSPDVTETPVIPQARRVVWKGNVGIPLYWTYSLELSPEATFVPDGTPAGPGSRTSPSPSRGCGPGT